LSQPFVILLGYKQASAWNLRPALCQKGRLFVIFPDVNYELSLEMEMLKRESWRRSTSSPKKVHTSIGDPYSMVTEYGQLKRLLAGFNLGKRISTACVI
jgi:hypothetical protein